MPGEDVQTFERDLPGQNSAGFNTKFVSDQLPLESSNTLNGSWGFNISDRKYKSAEEVEEMLARAAGNNSNLLLNIGPTPNGEIQPEFVERLHAVGEWVSRYGDSIYGTRGGPVAPGDWGVTTQTKDKVYVHVLHWNAPLLALPALGRTVKSAHLLVGGATIPVTQNADGVVLKVPAASKGEVDRVVVLELDSQ
jgi:alpha-L-fucosidase